MAEQELAALWTGAPDRAAVTGAANVIDKDLQFDPEEQGESRDRGRRILIKPHSALSSECSLKIASSEFWLCAVSKNGGEADPFRRTLEAYR